MDSIGVLIVCTFVLNLFSVSFQPQFESFQPVKGGLALYGMCTVQSFILMQPGTIKITKKVRMIIGIL